MNSPPEKLDHEMLYRCKNVTGFHWFPLERTHRGEGGMQSASAQAHESGDAPTKAKHRGLGSRTRHTGRFWQCAVPPRGLLSIGFQGGLVFCVRLERHDRVGLS